MKKITITMDVELWKKAKVKAFEAEEKFSEYVGKSVAGRIGGGNAENPAGEAFTFPIKIAGVYYSGMDAVYKCFSKTPKEKRDDIVNRIIEIYEKLAVMEKEKQIVLDKENDSLF